MRCVGECVHQDYSRGCRIINAWQAEGAQWTLTGESPPLTVRCPLDLFSGMWCLPWDQDCVSGGLEGGVCSARQGMRGESWSAGEDEPKVSFWGASLDMHLNWTDNLTFHDGETFSWRKVLASAPGHLVC